MMTLWPWARKRVSYLGCPTATASPNRAEAGSRSQVVTSEPSLFPRARLALNAYPQHCTDCRYPPTTFASRPRPPPPTRLESTLPSFPRPCLFHPLIRWPLRVKLFSSALSQSPQSCFPLPSRPQPLSPRPADLSLSAFQPPTAGATHELLKAHLPGYRHSLPYLSYGRYVVFCFLVCRN